MNNAFAIVLPELAYDFISVPIFLVHFLKCRPFQGALSTEFHVNTPRISINFLQIRSPKNHANLAQLDENLKKKRFCAQIGAKCSHLFLRRA